MCSTTKTRWIEWIAEVALPCMLGLLGLMPQVRACV